jgi:hypothetical protein
MRSIRLVGLSAILALATATSFASPARADEDHFDLSVANHEIKVTAKAGWHINADYSWAVKNGGDKIKVKEDFKLEKGIAVVSGVPAGTYTLKGAVCSESACAPFVKENVTIK